MKKKKLYNFLFIACMAGYIYLFFAKASQYTVCFFKNITGYACPSCGSTRAVMQLYHGDIIASLLLNPFGIIIATAMIVLPLWIVLDVALNKSSLYLWYQKAETFLKQKQVAIPLILLVIINWIWNIHKQL